MTPAAAAVRQARDKTLTWHRDEAARAWEAAARCDGEAREFRRAEAEWHDRAADVYLKQMERSDG